MIKLNDYIEIAFYKWLVNKKANINIFENEQETDIWIEKYLYENTKKWGIRFFLKLFQDYTLYEFRDFEELDLGKQFRIFCSGESSLRYVIPESIDKQVRLQPCLSGFVNYLKEVGVYQQINTTLLDIAATAYKENLSLEWWFKQSVSFASEDIARELDKYQGNTLTYSLFQDYVLWIQNKKNRYDYLIGEVHSFSFNDRRNNLKNMVSTDRIENFIWNNDNTVFHSYKEVLGKDHILLEFLHYLEHSKLDINNNIALPLLLKRVESFCNEYGKEHKKVLTNFAKNFKKKEGFISRIFQLFYKEQGKNFSIERLHVPKLHGILLFPRYSKMSRFLDEYLEDIHHMTGDTMDIYYTEDDIKNNSSCYQKVKKLVYMNGSNTKFPALLVWERFGGDVKIIVLKGLTHQEIFDVIEFLKNEIHKKSIPDGLQSTNDFIDGILKSKGAGKKTIYEIRDSQIGSVGDNSSSTNSF
ncbi:hypothetical protein [Paenibacillus amylolyticus]|uniref:hypothetical protein n=2 Tax=Paenibacillus TaxID=44249 RepID=UPI00339329B8